MNQPPVTLVVATSGRALAQSAARGGHAVAVLDCFADMDTRRHTVAAIDVASPDGPVIDPDRLGAAFDDLSRTHALHGLVWGSGLEAQPAVLRALAARLPVIGNPPETLAAVTDPRQFFTTLDALHIPYPVVSFDKVPNDAGWLIKQGASAGGCGVRRLVPGNAPALSTRAGAPSPGVSTYFQREVEGEPMSLLFLANGRDAMSVGFNTLTPAPQGATLYAWCGAISMARLPAGAKADVLAATRRLVPALGLRGLNSLDFIVDRAGRWHALEINARPTATLDLHDEDWPEGLFHWHLRACAGSLPAARPPREVRGHRVVFAQESGIAPRPEHWPPGCADIPSPGTQVRAGEPLCTVHAQSIGADGVTAALRAREAEIHHRWNRRAA